MVKSAVARCECSFAATCEDRNVNSGAYCGGADPENEIGGSCFLQLRFRISHRLNEIGKCSERREILFSVDAIQSLGAFPTTVEYVDFLSADAHKWMLGPLAIGIVYVRKECFDLCRPTLLGSWNVKAPGFIAQEEIEFQPTAQRYEPGAMNVMGIFGMKAAMDILLEIGIPSVADRILTIMPRLAGGLRSLGFTFLGPAAGPNASGIVTVSRPGTDIESLFERLTAEASSVPLGRTARGGITFVSALTSTILKRKWTKC